MSNNYDIVERLWTTANIKVNVIKLSPEVISEKLAILSDGSGIITSGEYDLFILNSAVLNVPFIFKVLDQHGDDGDKVAIMAKEIKKIILEVNPLFDPELLVITNENRIKIPDQNDKPGDVRTLTSNPMWNKVKVKDNDEIPSFGDLLPVGFSTMGKRFMSNEKFVTHIVEELDRTVEIIEYIPENIPEIFKDKYVFEDDEKYSAEVKYKMYILTKCLDDFTRLFFDLDKEGATEHFGEEGLINILYKACLVHNPFLDYNDIDLEKVRRVVLKMFGENTKVSKFSKTAPKKKVQVDKDFVDVSEEDILSLPGRMKDKVIGQDDIIDSICEVIQVSSCGLKEKDQPIGSFMFNGSTGVGKCHGKGTKIRMYNGSVKKVEDIVIGDLLMGDDSLPRRVLSLARGQDRMFRVSPTRGDSFTCNLAHVLTLKDNTTGEVVDVPIEQYINSSATFRRRKRLFRVPVEYKNIEVPSDPYLIGLSICDDAMDDDLSFIATSYLINSRNNRLLFISGLLDSDSCTVDGSTFIINTASQDLAADIVSICLSVGMYASKKVKVTNNEQYFSVFIYNTVSDLKLKVKNEYMRQMSIQFTNSADFSMMNFSVDEIDFNDYYGFTLDGNGRYLLYDYIVTHNTHCARILAEELCGSEENLIRIDCSEYSQPHEVSKLIGAPSGYVGHDEGGYLTNAIVKKPFSIVLFDEIEKAHPKLHNILLQIFDAGRVTSGKGETVSFEEAVIILTSNVGVKEVEDVKKRIGFGDVSVLTKEKNDKAVSEGLKNTFNPEFLNRIDVIKTFNNLSKEDCLKIVVLAFNKLNEWLNKNNVVIHYNKDVLEYIYNKGFKPGFGARPLKRTMKKEVFLPVSKLMLDNKARNNCSITIKVSNDTLVFKHKPLKRRVLKGKKES